MTSSLKKINHRPRDKKPCEKVNIICTLTGCKKKGNQFKSKKAALYHQNTAKNNYDKGLCKNFKKANIFDVNCDDNITAGRIIVNTLLPTSRKGRVRFCVKAQEEFTNRNGSVF